MTQFTSRIIRSPHAPFAAVFAAFSVLVSTHSNASENLDRQSVSTGLNVPSNLDCGKPKSPTAKSICADISAKYYECVKYNERLGNTYDCGNDKGLGEWRALAASAEEKHGQASKPGVRIGMTKKQVIEKTRWGAPKKINSTVLMGRVSEQWVYEDGHYIYFENGRVKAIQTSE